MKRLVLYAFTLLLPIASAGAQSSSSFQRGITVVQADDSTAPARPNLISVNPLGVVFGYFSAELEHSFAPSGSIAVAGSYDGTGDFGYNSADLIFRYYPSAEGIRGFAIGATTGYTHVSSDQIVYPACLGCYDPYAQGASNAFTLGIQGDYSWWIGKEQRFGIELGIGAKRLFYTGSGRRGSEALPTGRLSIGWGF